MAGWFVLGGEDPKPSATPPSASGTPSTPPGAGTSPSPSPSTSPGGAATSSSPAPYTVVRNEKGFSVAVPAGWEPSGDETGPGSFYRRPGDRSALLQIFRITEPDSVDACELLRISSRNLGANPGYREVSLDPLSGEVCELVYEYDSEESQGRRRGIERIVVAIRDGPAVRANLTAALDSFRPD